MTQRLIPVSRVHAGGQALLIGDLCEQVGEGVVLGSVEAGAKVGFVVPGDSADALELVLTGGGQAERVLPAVGSTALALDQASALERVHECDHAAGEQTKTSGLICRSDRASAPA